MFWNVLATPWWVTRWTGSPISSWPSNLAEPCVARSTPEIKLNTVVLPAPLGPTRLTISPSSTSKDRSSTATSPPKVTVRSRTSRITGRSPTGRSLTRRRVHDRAGGGLHLGPRGRAGGGSLGLRLRLVGEQLCRPAHDQPRAHGYSAQEALGPEDHEDDQDETEDDVLVEHELLQREGKDRDDRRAHDGARNAGQPAQDDHDEDQHGLLDVVVARKRVVQVGRGHRADQTRHDRTRSERQQPVEIRVDAHYTGRELVFPYREPGPAGAAAAPAQHAEHEESGHSQREPVVGPGLESCAVYDREAVGQAKRIDQVDTLGAARDVQRRRTEPVAEERRGPVEVQDELTHDQPERKRHDGQVVAAQTERWCGHHEGEERRDDQDHRDSRPEWQVEMQLVAGDERVGV